MEIDGKKVIVTGGANGIGRFLVEAFVRRGAIVGAFDINLVGLERLKDDFPDVDTINCDVTDYLKTQESVGMFFDKHDRIDILINNAGYIYSSPLIKFGIKGTEKHDPEMWQKVINLNLTSVFNMSSHVVEKMMAKRTKGVIVNVSSVSSAGNIGQCAYSAAKAGINAMTMTMAKELGMMGIRCVAIAPGFIETHSTKEALSDDARKDWIRKVPLNRMGTGDEITKGIFSIIENDYFNGKVFEIDGGLVL